MSSRVWASLVAASIAALFTASHLESRAGADDSASVTPPAVYSVGAAFDRGRGRLVVFGGYIRGQYVGDTWEWDGHRWSRSSATGPIARNGPVMTYDPDRRCIVLFGGDTHDTGSLADTWLYDGAWRQAAAVGPPARTGHAMAYDTDRHRLVLFGGDNAGSMRGDTWEWNGTQWTRMSDDGPAARSLFGMAYDAVRGRTVLFGGTSTIGPTAGPSHGDTWEWDGVRWTRSTATGPSARDHIAMDYDAISQRVVLHGGGMDAKASSETWTFDGGTWTRVSTAGPPRRFARLSFDSTAKGMLLYGGFDREPSNELWRYDASGWHKMIPR